MPRWVRRIRSLTGVDAVSSDAGATRGGSESATVHASGRSIAIPCLGGAQSVRARWGCRTSPRP